MFNIKEFFSKSEPVALSVSPYLRFSSVGKEVKVIIDSGEEDLNQKVAQTRLTEEQSANIYRIFVRGFDTIYHELSDNLAPETSTTPDGVLAKPASANTATSDRIEAEIERLDKKDVEPTVEVATESQEAKPVALVKNTLTMDQLQNQVFPSDEYHNDRTVDASLISNIKEAFEHEEGIIFGQVCLELNNKEVFVVANPIYTVVPAETEDGLEFVAVDTAKSYISEEWHEEFASALVSMSSDLGEDMPARTGTRRGSDSEGASKGMKLGLAAAFVGLLAFTYAIASPIVSKVKSPQSAQVAAPFSSLMPQTTASAAPKSDYDPYAISTTGIPSAEQMAQMQTAATHDVLKSMNVDLNSTADLGCLSQ